MRCFARLIVALSLLASILSVNPISTATAAGSDTPVGAASALDDSIFAVQVGLMDGDVTKADAGLRDVRAAVGVLSGLVPFATTLTTDLTKGVDTLADQAARNDQVGVALARGTMRGIVLQISFAATMRAAEAGNTEQAQAWLLVRDFAQSTRLARQSADATLALRSLKDGSIAPADAAAIVRAELLDTYQGEVRQLLDELADDVGRGQSLAMAQSIGMISALWPVLEPSYVQQFGTADAAALTGQIESLPSRIESIDNSLLDPIAVAIDSFRAAPLSPEEQSGGARQMMLYLGLVPVEYGRGIRNGAVASDIEIQEAITFLDGARAAFADLRPSLNQVDTTATTALGSQLDQLDSMLAAAQNRTSIAEPDQIKALAGAIESATRTLVPHEWLRTGGDADFDVVASLLEQMETAAAAGQYKQAESARLEAYAIYDSGAEKRLLAFAPKLAQTIEVAFWQGSSGNPGLATLIANEAPTAQISSARTDLVRDLNQARQRLGAGSTARGAIIFNAASIVFREGLEAVLILASLLASMTGANRRLKRPLALGAIGALAATAALFVLARTVLLSLGQYSEQVEAVVSVLAIGVLLLVMNWFFHKVYWTKWIAKHHNRRRIIIGGLAGQAFGLVALGFTSVFREGAETVLFLQALVLDAGTTVVIEGTLLGLIGVTIVGVLMFALQAKLPHKKMLVVTGLMISLVLVTMVGKTVHVLQAVGWMPIHPIGDAPPPYWMSLWLGIFPTWDGLLLQMVAGMFVIGSYFAAEHSHKRSLQRMLAQSQSMQPAG